MKVIRAANKYPIDLCAKGIVRLNKIYDRLLMMPFPERVINVKII